METVQWLNLLSQSYQKESYGGKNTKKHIPQILLAITVTAILVGAFALYTIIQFGGRDIANLKFTYYDEVVTSKMVRAVNAKDPEFFRLPDHSIFADNGYYYVVLTAHIFPAVLRTNDFKTYEFVATIGLVGKVAPYAIYDPQRNKFYLFYSDWLNTIESDIRYARLGLAIGNYSKDIASIKFEDQGYLKIAGSPLIDPSAGWDPYIVKVNDTFWMLFSSAIHGVHLASAQNLGTDWKYVTRIVYENRENPALFRHNDVWYMLLGIYDAPGYDLYSSKDFLTWKLVKRGWFTDPEHPVLPAGSTCVLINGTLYHLYQVPLGTDYVSGPFSLKLAYATLAP